MLEILRWNDKGELHWRLLWNDSSCTNLKSSLFSIECVPYGWKRWWVAQSNAKPCSVIWIYVSQISHKNSNNTYVDIHAIAYRLIAFLDESIRTVLNTFQNLRTHNVGVCVWACYMAFLLAVLYIGELVKVQYEALVTNIPFEQRWEHGPTGD